ncbi:MAG: hypothetical protein FWC16_11190 [Defluviitaleaceae bacterium]|nr:hypothetical protein [Defluviitaleaceae bacterium]MCL2275482.1 hypothetical protein [Defluviitaleaceae bacterium]
MKIIRKILGSDYFLVFCVGGMIGAIATSLSIGQGFSLAVFLGLLVGAIMFRLNRLENKLCEKDEVTDIPAAEE